MTAYYVQPEPSASGGETYWLEGYAVGDAKFAAAQSDGTSTTLTAPTRVQIAAMLSEGEVTSLFGGNRVVAAGVSQSPASATVTGSVRIRTAGVRSSSTGTTLVGGYRVRPNGSLSQAAATTLIGANATFDAYIVPRSLYVEADYWAVNYVDYAISSHSSVQPLIVRPTGASALATSTPLVSGGRIRTKTGAVSAGEATQIIAASVTYSSNALLTQATSIMLASLSEKWIDLAEDGDIWTDQAEDTDTWSLVAEASGTWTNISEDTDIWTDVSEDTDTWVDESPLT